MADESRPQNPVEHPEHAPSEGNLKAAASHVQAGARDVLAEAGLQREGPSMATVVLVGAGVAIVEPELIPGMLIGAGAWLAPKLLPSIGSMLRPAVKGIVKAAYSATTSVREMAAEASEQIEDMVAEAKAEQQAGNGTSRPESPPAPEGSSGRQRRQGRGPSTTH
jgi:hypothetical protein